MTPSPFKDPPGNKKSISIKSPKREPSPIKDPPGNKPGNSIKPPKPKPATHPENIPNLSGADGEPDGDS